MLGKEPVQQEPTLIIQTIVAALVAVQVAAIGMPTWTHTVVAIVIVALGAIVNRSQVSPAKTAVGKHSQ